MKEEECEIEYLDEDEDLVQQYVQTAPELKLDNSFMDIEDKVTPLLVERKPFENRRKPRSEEEDSDYDPSEDLLPQRKKRKVAKKAPKNLSIPQRINYHEKKPMVIPHRDVKIIKLLKDEVAERKKLKTQIPDYEDPLCLPVKAIMNGENDKRALSHWNKLCFEAYKKSDTLLKPNSGKTVSSSRTIVLRNVKNTYGKVDTTIWSKTNVVNEKGALKSELFQSVLPRYREKKPPKSTTTGTTLHRDNKKRCEVVLACEKLKDEDTLVVYKSDEAVSAVYKSVKKNEVADPTNEAKTTVMEEIACCKVCAPCFQTSWRGVRKNSSQQQKLSCKICNNTFVSVYNLLQHLKTHHSHDEVRRHLRYISRALSAAVDYHYKCRICQQQCTSIKQLRQHVKKHIGVNPFKCEIGNHMAY